jgi:hypothetical protein
VPEFSRKTGDHQTNMAGQYTTLPQFNHGPMLPITNFVVVSHSQT